MYYLVVFPLDIIVLFSERRSNNYKGSVSDEKSNEELHTELLFEAMVSAQCKSFLKKQISYSENLV